jgi:hypothetical protein
MDRVARVGAGVGSLQDDWAKVLSGQWDCEVTLIDEGVGGSYWVKARGKGRSDGVLGIFKPGDEEPGAVNNPKGFEVNDNEKGDIRPGEGWVREIMAHQLDHFHFAGVPETIRVRLPNAMFEKEDRKRGCKVGSLQRFVQSSDGSSCRAACDMGPGAFPTDDVHRIGILDIRLLNSDRHGGNLLVRRDARGAPHLVPIDHAYVLPRHCADLDFEWLFWPQSKEPFGAEALAYIAALNPDADAVVLARAGVPDECADLLRAATAALQIAGARGLSLRTIGRFLRRERMYELSDFERAVLEARRPLEQGGGIEFDRLQILLEDELGARCESPLLKPVRAQAVTLKEEVLVGGVTAEPPHPEADGTYLIKTSAGVSIATFWVPAARRGRVVFRDRDPIGRKDLISRELAAYRLDHDGWAGVPETIELRLSNDLFPAPAPRTAAGLFRHGVVQRFIPGASQPLCEVPTEALPVAAVHRIGILDLRLCNGDRHCRSLICVQNDHEEVQLVPTVHAGCLPASLEDVRFPWTRWPQANVPFSPAEVLYVQRLEPDLDARTLRDLEISPECVELHEVATHTLQAAVARGFTLRQIGLLFERPALAQPSQMERLVAEVRTSLDDGGHVDLDLLRRILPARLEAFLSEAPPEAPAGSLDPDGGLAASCCVCPSAGALSTLRDTDGEDSADTETSSYSFASSDDLSFAWGNGSLAERSKG